MISEPLGQKENTLNQSESPTSTKKEITDAKILLDSDKEKNVEVNAPAIKDLSLNKENQQKMIDEKGLNNENKIQLKETQEVTTNLEKRSDDQTRDENNMIKLPFLHNTKFKVDTSLQVDSWLYNEIIILTKKNGIYAERTG